MPNKPDSEASSSEPKVNGDSNLAWAFRMMMALLLAIGAYYGKNVDASVHSIAETQKVMEERIGERVRQLEVFRAQTETSRFTSNEAAALRRELDALIGSNEKRVTRVEDALLNIDKSLAALVKKLEVKP